MRILIFLCFVLAGCQEKAATTAKSPPDSVNSGDNIYIEEAVHGIDYDTTEWTEILPGKIIQLDIRYATRNNFTKQKIYDCPRCFLKKESAKVLYQIVNQLSKSGYGIKLFDCYRPHPAQQKLWNIVPNPMYVADPAKGSMHNRGLAVDLTLIDENGQELDMGTSYDHFGKEAYHDYYNHDGEILKRRNLLKETMARYGFVHTRTEWWHYSDTKISAEISNFEWPCPE
jgi:D-alanyl-D-alanine dipeptidase